MNVGIVAPAPEVIFHNTTPPCETPGGQEDAQEVSIMDEANVSILKLKETFADSKRRHEEAEARNKVHYELAVHVSHPQE